jgi:hypothetical protein
VEPKVYESVILNLEYLKTTTEGIISTGWVVDIWVRGLLNKSVIPIWQKFLDLHNNKKLFLILSQWNWIDSGANLLRHIPFWPSKVIQF